MEKPLVSVIVLNYNGKQHLKDCFNSLYHLNYNMDDVEFILVDNKSQDGSVEFMRRNYKEVKIIQLKKNYGFASGNNIGVRKSTGKYIVLLNNDTCVDKNWLKELIIVAESSEKIGIVGSKIYRFNYKNIINVAGSYGDKCLITDCTGRKKIDSKYYSIQRDILFACGAAMLIKRELYSKIGLFDPSYFMYCEDLDLSIRSWLYGLKVVIAPKSKIYHKIEGKQTKLNSYFKNFLLERNRLRTILKNYELRNVLYLFPAYIIKKMGILVVSGFNLKKNVIYLFSIFRSIIWNLKNIQSLIKYRYFIQNIRRINDKSFFKIIDNIRSQNSL